MPRIISDELFDSVSKIICSRKRLKNYHGKRQTYLLTGKIFCGNCGSAYCGGIRYSGKRYTPYVFYTCSKKQRQAGMTCKTKEIRKEYIEEYVLKEIISTVLSDEKILTLVKKYQDFYANKIGVAEDELNTIRSNIKSCETKNSNLVSVIAKSGIAAC